MKPIALIITTLICSFVFTGKAQDEIKYNNPPNFITSDLRIYIEDAVATDAYSKLKIVLDNKSKNTYVVLIEDMTAFEYEGLGKYYPKKSKELVVAPSDKGSTVVKVERDIDYRKPAYNLLLEGIMTGSPSGNLPLEKLTLVPGTNSKSNAENITFEFEEFEGKKGKYSVKANVSFNGNNNELLIVDPSKFKLISSNGEVISAVWNRDKSFALRPGETEKLKLSFESNETTFSLDQSESFQKIALSTFQIDPFKLTDSNPIVEKVKTIEPEKNEVVENENKSEKASTSISTKSSCPPFMGAQNGSVKIKVYSEDGLCFKLDIDGFPAITDFTSNAFVYANPGRRRYTLTMSDGTVIEDKVYIADTYEEIGYRIKSKGDSDYAMKYVVGDQVLNAKGQQEREAMMASTTASSKAALEKSQGGASSSGNNGNSGEGNCFGDASSGAKRVKLKVTWKGSPVVGHGIQIKVGAPLGNNITDGSGNVTISVSQLPSSTIDVYGCKGNNSWSVTGDWVQLDGSNYFHLKLDEVAKFMAEMMGMTVDQIGAGWGM